MRPCRVVRFSKRREQRRAESKSEQCASQIRRDKKRFRLTRSTITPAKSRRARQKPCRVAVAARLEKLLLEERQLRLADRRAKPFRAENGSRLRTPHFRKFDVARDFSFVETINYFFRLFLSSERQDEIFFVRFFVSSVSSSSAQDLFSL